jgi:hypothetical protein
MALFLKDTSQTLGDRLITSDPFTFKGEEFLLTEFILIPYMCLLFHPTVPPEEPPLLVTGA